MWLRLSLRTESTRQTCLGLVVLGACLVPGCSGSPHGDPPGPPAPAGPAWFGDVTDEVGLDFVHDAGPVDGKYFLPQIIGSGAALFDFNNDGLLDILLLQNGGPSGARN